MTVKSVVISTMRNLQQVQIACF